MSKVLVPCGGDLWWFWEPLAFCFPGVQEGVSSPFSSGINYFCSRVLSMQGKGAIHQETGGLHGQRGVVRCGPLCLLVNKIKFRILKREVAGGLTGRPG